MRILNVVAPVGLKETISLSGAVVCLCDSWDQVRVFCWPEDFASTAAIFARHHKVEIAAVDYEDEMTHYYGTALRLGGYNDGPISGSRSDGWEKWFYDQMGIPFENRWDRCPVEQACADVTQDEVPVLRPIVDPECTRRPEKFHLANLRGGNILRHYDNLVKSPEIHAANGAFLRLADSLSSGNGELFFHAYTQVNVPINQVPLKRAWKIVD